MTRDDSPSIHYFPKEKNMTDAEIRAPKNEALQMSRGVPPPVHRTEKNTAIQEVVTTLVQAADLDKGVWYSMPIPEGLPLNAIHPMVGRVIVKEVAEVSARAGQIWVRFHK